MTSAAVTCMADRLKLTHVLADIDGDTLFPEIDPAVWAEVSSEAVPAGEKDSLTLAQFKAMVREQFFMLLIDQEAALAAIPALLPPGADERQAALAAIRDLISASGEPSGEAAERMRRVVALFDGGKPRFVSVANS